MQSESSGASSGLSMDMPIVITPSKAFVNSDATAAITTSSTSSVLYPVTHSMPNDLPNTETIRSGVSETQPPINPSRVVRKTPIERRDSNVGGSATDKGGPKSLIIPKENIFIGRTIKKPFYSNIYFTGQVVSYNRPYYTINYVDGDSEDMDESEVKKWVVPT